ncbi:BMP family protein [Hydrogenophaga electricum]|uniref:ABC transporter substrate-binding protein n=1 Tax=Hydrogenophaga electricum TaxID=1230953 RepID=A0ABQ6C8A0_9BURK|nr:BMP family protein [Hydrogenophaga electricum]GLS16374.1 ABC transporter substrate-binding protein [Hydrogenophaga electricum]
MNEPHLLSRRHALIGFSATALGLGACATRPAPSPVNALFAGQVNDQGFMQSGYEGFVQAQKAFGLSGRYIDKVAPRKELLEAALRDLAGGAAGLVIAHGGQNNAAAQQVASEFPNVRFVVTQGNVKAANLSSYEVLQEQSAFLAGALAALTTRTGVVGHMSGIRVTPGLKGRAAFAAGVAATDPKVKLLTNFSGNQDDNALSKRIALAQMDAGADVIFTMLNAGRQGVTDACAERQTRQIGNVIDWTQRNPGVFIGSAMATVSKAVFAAARDHAEGRWQGGVLRQIGLEDPEAVRLALAPDVAAPVRAALESVRRDIAAGKVRIPEQYTGPEFTA